MRLQIKGLNELRDRLANARIQEVAARALADAARQVADAVKDGLSEPSGAGDHDRPWLRTGALRDSIESTADGLSAAIGSNDPAARPQELGTTHLPPRPFLAPVAAAVSEGVAQAVGAAVSAALKGDTADNPITLVGNAPAGTSRTIPYNPLGVFVPGSPENEAWVRGTMQRLQSLGHVFHSEETSDTPSPTSPGLAKPGEATLPDDRRQYILDGDGKGGGGHGPGRATPDKTKFPPEWTDEEVIGAIIDIANDPGSTRMPTARGRTEVVGTRRGVEIKVIIGGDGKTIVSGYPTNAART